MHASAPGTYGKPGRTRCGEINSLSIALKLGGPVAAIGHRIDTEKNPRRDKCDQDDAANLGKAPLSGYSTVSQSATPYFSNSRLQTSGRLADRGLFGDPVPELESGMSVNRR